MQTSDAIAECPRCERCGTAIIQAKEPHYVVQEVYFCDQGHAAYHADVRMHLVCARCWLVAFGEVKT